MSLGDVLGNRQTQTGAVRAFRGKERLKYSCYRLRRHPTTCVGYPETAAINLTASAKLQNAAIRHCIDRIKDQIEAILSRYRAQQVA